MISSTETILEDYKAGKMVILIDDENRENEGDIIMSASHITAEHINFMATHARGLICLTLTETRCNQLELKLMESNHSNSTNFTVSIDSADASTGISAAERAHTIQQAINPSSKAKHFIHPGHIFPLMAREGGVLVRAGHTEAGCDLSALAGDHEPASVIVEIMNEDGTMARLPNLIDFAKKHQLKLGTIADLIRYRMKQEKIIQFRATHPFPTALGAFSLHTYFDVIEQSQHIAITYGNYQSAPETLIRVHMYSPLHDALQAKRKPGQWTLNNAMQAIKDNGHGAIILLNSDGITKDWSNLIDQWSHPDKHPVVDDKTFGKGASIIASLGIQKIRVLGSPWGNNTLTAFGIEVLAFVAPE